MKLGSVGTGWIVEEFIKGAKMVPGLNYTACYSRKMESGEMFAKKFDEVQVFTSLEEMAKSDIDCVYIASPNACHTEQSRLFLESGKHVICEKPIAVEPDELRELQQLAASKALIYMEAIIGMHIPELKVMEEAVKTLGAVSFVRLDYSKYSSKYPAFLRGENPNIFNPKMATGGLMDMGIYCVYPIIHLFGKPKTVSATALFLSTGSDASGSALLGYSDKTAVISYSKITRTGTPSEIKGENGALLIPAISNLNNMTFLPTEEGEANPAKQINGKTPKHNQMYYEAQSFYDFIVSRDENIPRYTYLTGLSLAVCETLADVRNSADIKF